MRQILFALALCGFIGSAQAENITITPGVGGGAPGGSSGQVQYNNGGAFGGIADWTTGGTSDLTATLGTVTATTRALSIAATFNNAAATISSPFLINVLNTASQQGSTIAEFQVGGNDVVAIYTQDGTAGGLSSPQVLINAGAPSGQAPFTGDWSSHKILDVQGLGGVISHAYNGQIAQFIMATLGGSTLSTPTAVASGAQIGALLFNASDGTNTATQQTAQIGVLTTEQWSNTAHGAYMNFAVTPTGSTTRASQMRLQASGGLTVGNSIIATDPGVGAINAATSVTVAAGSPLTSTGPGGALTSLAYTSPGAGVAILLGGASSGTGGPAGTASPTFTGTPAAPTASASTNTTQLATTAYVTTAVANAVAGVNPAVAVQAATTQASDTSGLTYNNGVAGIGATFTGSVNTAFTVDGFTFTALNQRVLIKNDTQSPSGAFNGIYYVTQVQTGILAPILTRALDYDAPSDINNTGAIPVVNGTVNGTTSWLLTSAVATVGTDPLTYTKFSVNPITTPQTLGQSRVPFVLVSSGTMGNNGALSGLTAVAVQYPSAYVWMPSGAISAGSAAGWYFAQFSSTTAATVFNNTYTSGTPTIPGSPTSFSTTGPGAYTQTTGSNIAAYTLTILGNTIGANGQIIIQGTRTSNNTAGAKTLSAAYDTFTFGSQAQTTQVNNPIYGGFFNRGATNVQAQGPNIVALGLATAGLLVGAIDSTQGKNLVMNMQLATATDTMTLESIAVQVTPGVP